jgi:hypothetical protein
MAEMVCDTWDLQLLFKRRHLLNRSRISDSTTILGSHNILVIHGVAAMLTILALGSVLPFHLKAGLKSKRKWWSGLGQLSFLSALMITGLLLYYGPEPIRETVVSTHWVLGLLFFAVFLIHIPMGLNKQARS